MLKKRIIPIVLVKDSTTVKGVNFNSWRRVGSVTQAIKVFVMRDVDELLLLDIGASPNNRSLNFSMIEEQALLCTMPLTVGGGIKSIEDIKRTLKAGADKVLICSEAVTNHVFVEKASKIFGSQCIVVCIDVKKNKNGIYRVCSNAGAIVHDLCPFEYMKTMENLGAGEIVINDIDNDGCMNGYDINLVKKISGITIPIVVAGGCGQYEHMSEVLKYENISGVAAGSIFYFTEKTPKEAKIYLNKQNILVRKT